MTHGPASLIELDDAFDVRDWRVWSEVARDAPPFLAPRFFDLARPFITPSRPMLASAWTSDGIAMTGVLPLALDGSTLRGLRSEHSPGYDYCGNADGIAAIWDCLRDDDRWSELVLDRVPADSLLAHLLPKLARLDGCPAIVRPDRPHPYFALPDFAAAMHPKFRANLQRCRRKAGAVVFERVQQPTPGDLADAAALEAMAWKATAGTNIAADPRAQRLYGEVAQLAFLRIAGKRVAVMYSVEDARTLYALKIGYDPAFANLSPGHLLVYEVALDAERRGLLELDFVGRVDEWKRKWTELVHERCVVVIYRRSARGLVRYALREVVKPHLPEPLRASPRSPLPRRCQRRDVLGAHALTARVSDRLRSGLGIRSGLRRALHVGPTTRLGQPSAFATGSWVRVRDEAAIRATLDPRDKLRGLAFTGSQWLACGRVFRVESHVRRLRDDHGVYRPVSRTVLLAGVDCGYGATEPTGCGRHCPMMFRDEWLEAAPAIHAPPPGAQHVRHARVRDLAEIAAGLDLFGRRDGVTFMPEMEAYANRRFAITGTLPQVYELDRWVAPRAPVYLLESVACTGAICGDDGPCDRRCTLMWHADWLIVDPA